MLNPLPIEITAQLPVLALCMMRPLGMMLLLPLFKGGAMGSALIRNSLILLFALPTVPAMDDMQQVILQADTWSLFSLYGKEVVVGFLLGFCAAIPFWAIDMAGFVIDTMRGASMSTVLNPLMGLQSSIYGMLFTQVLTVLFLVSGGFNHLLSAMYQSYNQLPPGFDLSLTQPLLVFIGHEWQLMCQLCLSFAMPAMVIMILVDVALGLVNRSAQQLNVFFLSMPIKSALVLLLLIYSLQFALAHYLERITGVEQQTGILFGLLSGH
ncbi:EscT/YscT/HrcT family type III secretion system export apparatus protein [Shewanella psychropiezotolerans]|uniref:EscT/YscT/HrcT family type III secretion system export apparatus protein n=1 Tax=Shewanella psychropiezotolerans TaxID=2593655 RepID=A0ABX5WYQ4_9GAMM|nr:MULTISPECIES: type III secretion system export apparatus subunit SctT [Shewanella]MPY23963.1 EscT/YscT/HrcT family type III secretion system export apparatus protein [Shewanella sp. YLB-07]QDO84225.1 EscT/YscT/HrcT family type III secretion system export apparatus protein [Shewanella psychropiezotolerans]